MKRLYTILIGLVLTVFTSFSQEQYNNAMIAALTELSNTKTAAEILDISNTFERIAQAEPTQWLPFYYAGYTMLVQTFMIESNSDKEKAYDKALEFADNAAKISANNSEILTLKAFILSMKISIDPMKYGMKYGMEVDNLLKEAVKLNPNNPRAYMLKAENLFYTPEQFGGSKIKACENANIALELFITQKPTNTIVPSWGKEETEKIIAQCNKNK